MIHTFKIKNYKSIPKLQLRLGRVNVFIGENGAGKSNILESIALLSAASSHRLDNEFLFPRGIRIPSPEFVRSAFVENDEDIRLKATFNDQDSLDISVHVENESTYPKWTVRNLSTSEQTEGLGLPFLRSEALGALVGGLQSFSQYPSEDEMHSDVEWYKERLSGHANYLQWIQPQTKAAVANVRSLSKFLIYSPAYSTLRTFETEGQIRPLGVRGEGLFSHLKVLALKHVDVFQNIIEGLRLLGWYDGLEFPKRSAPFETTLKIRDRYLYDGAFFDQKSVNEGFFFILFYLVLLYSPDTPKILAIDNIDASLNPKLCQKLIKMMVEIADSEERQVMITTHNPAVLDGLDLHDPNQTLFVVKRDSNGCTVTRRVRPPKTSEDGTVKLSEAFMSGYIGGLPNNF